MAPATDLQSGGSRDVGGVERVEIERVATGGDGVGRLQDGIVVFVADAVPGDSVSITLTERKKRFARGEIVEVLAKGPARVEPSCAHVADGCGGCDWQHVDPSAQSQMKASIVTDSLQRLGRIEGAVAAVDTGLDVGGHRTTVRCLIQTGADEGGRAGFRRRGSHDQVVVDSCEAAHPLIEELIVEGRFGTAEEVVLRVGARTGERLALVSPNAGGVVLPDDVIVIGADELDAGAEAFFHESVAGRRWRVSARSFFQTRPDGAERLVELVRAAVDEAPDGKLVDLYSGVGLFAGTVANGRSCLAIESAPSSVADARVNIGNYCALIEGRVEQWKPKPAAVVVADPARSGLGKAGVPVVVGTGASVVVLVSCDAGSLGRDAGLLDGAGYKWQSSTVVDMFPNTSHIEVVSVFHVR